MKADGDSVEPSGTPFAVLDGSLLVRRPISVKQRRGHLSLAFVRANR